MRALFARQLHSGAHHGAQVAAFVRGECVVDLHGFIEHTYRGSRVDYGARSIQNIYSSTKALTSLVVALLADRGHLRYDQRVVDIWPEFAAATAAAGGGGAGGAGGDGDTAARLRKKAALTVADVMRHEGGLAKVAHTFTFEELSAKGVQGNSVGRVLEGARQEWPAETTRQ